MHLHFNYAQQQNDTGKRSGSLPTRRLASWCQPQVSLAVRHGPYSEFGDLLTIRGFHWASATSWTTSVADCTSRCYGAAFRGYAAAESEFPFEVCVDNWLEKVGIDPFDFRYTNLWKEGDTNRSQQNPDVYCMKEIFEQDASHLRKLQKAYTTRSTDEVKCATGIAFGSYAAGLDGPDSASAWADSTKTAA